MRFYVFLSAVFHAAVLNSTDLDDTICKDNSIPKSQTDGISLCVLQAAVTLYSSTGCMMTLLSLSFDLFLKIVLHSDIDLMLVYTVSIFVMPIVPLAHVIAEEQLGYGGTDPLICNIKSGDKRYDHLYDSYYYPTMAISGCSTLLICVCGAKLMQERINTMQKVAEEEFSSDCTLSAITYAKRNMRVLIFLVFVVGSWDVMSVIWYLGKSFIKEAQNATEAWLRCLFLNYSGDSSVATALCGERPDKDSGRIFAIVGYVATIGQALICTIALLLSTLFNHYSPSGTSAANRITPELNDNTLELKSVHPSHEFNSEHTSW